MCGENDEFVQPKHTRLRFNLEVRNYPGTASASSHGRDFKRTELLGDVSGDRMALTNHDVIDLQNGQGAHRCFCKKYQLCS